jgi:hypothetical protein
MAGSSTTDALQAGVKRHLDKRPAEGVAHDDRLGVQALNDLADMVHHLSHTNVRQRRGVVAQRSHAAVPGSMPG